MDTFIITVTLLISIASFITILFGVLHSTTPEERKDFIEKFNQREENDWDTYNEEESPSTPGTAAWFLNRDD